MSDPGPATTPAGTGNGMLARVRGWISPPDPGPGTRLRRWMVTLLVVLASVGALLSAVALWTNGLLFNTDRWVETVGPVLQDPQVTHDLSVLLSERAIEATDLEVLEFALVENLQREDLNPIEEALAYKRLAEEFKLRQEEIAKKVGKSRAAVANTMRLLELDGELQTHLVQGRLSVGHAKALLGLRTAEDQRHLAAQVMKKGLSVRGTEDLVNEHLSKGGTTRKGRSRKARTVSAAVQHLENRLQQHFSTRVEIHHGDEKGRILIEYYGNDDLQRLLSQLGLPQE